MWWLILCVNLMGSPGTRYLVKHCLWVCLWRCFLVRLALELVEWVKQIALPNVGGHHPAHCGPELSRRQRGRPCLLQDCGSWHMGLPWPCAAPHTIRSPASQAFGLRLNHTTGFPGSPTRRGQTVGRLSLHNCMRQLLVKNLCTPYWFCFSGEPWLISWGKNLYSHFSKADIQIANWHMKRCSSGKWISKPQ